MFVLPMELTDKRYSHMGCLPLYDKRNITAVT